MAGGGALSILLSDNWERKAREEKKKKKDNKSG